jgi:hypothetical protein
MPVKISRLTVHGDPKEVELVISDNPARKNATVWIRARFPFEQFTPQERFAVLAQNVIDELQQLADQAKKNAQAEPR